MSREHVAQREEDQAEGRPRGWLWGPRDGRDSEAHDGHNIKDPTRAHGMGLVSSSVVHLVVTLAGVSMFWPFQGKKL